MARREKKNSTFCFLRLTFLFKANWNYPLILPFMEFKCEIKAWVHEERERKRKQDISLFYFILRLKCHLIYSFWGFIQQRVSASFHQVPPRVQPWTSKPNLLEFTFSWGGRNNEPMEKQFKKNSFLKQGKVIECHETPLEWVVLRFLRGGDI